MNLVVIYEAAFNTVDAVLDYLKKQGYDAVALEHPYSDLPRMTDPSRHTLRDFISPLTYVAVPRDQETDARRAIGEFHLPSQKRLAARCETLLFQILIASLVTFIAAIMLVLYNPFDVYFPVLYAVWLGAFIFVANLGRINAMLDRQRKSRMWHNYQSAL